MLRTWAQLLKANYWLISDIKNIHELLSLNNSLILRPKWKTDDLVTSFSLPSCSLGKVKVKIIPVLLHLSCPVLAWYVEPSVSVNLDEPLKTRHCGMGEYWGLLCFERGHCLLCRAQSLPVWGICSAWLSFTRHSAKENSDTDCTEPFVSGLLMFHLKGWLL